MEMNFITNDYYYYIKTDTEVWVKHNMVALTLANKGLQPKKIQEDTYKSNEVMFVYDLEDWNKFFDIVEAQEEWHNDHSVDSGKTYCWI